MFKRHPIVASLAVAYFIALCWIVLGPRADGGSTYLGGIILFLPLGPIVVALRGRRQWMLALSLGVIASVWTQLACVVWRPDAHISSWDLSANLLGVALGTAAAVMVMALVSLRAGHPAQHDSHGKASSFTTFSQPDSSGLSTEASQD
ncbi:MAG: hypothetical protein ACOH1T_03950 [Microbacteriaceae bacterium]